MVALSTTKAEYIAATHAYKEAIWLKRLCSDIEFKQDVVTIYSDSQIAISLVKNPTFHARTKHIDVQYHFVRDMVEDGKVKLEKVETLVNVDDALTKPMSIEKFRWCSKSMGLSALAIKSMIFLDPLTLARCSTSGRMLRTCVSTLQSSFGKF